MTIFGLKYEQDLENWAALPHQAFPGVPLPPDFCPTFVSLSNKCNLELAATFPLRRLFTPACLIFTTFVPVHALWIKSDPDT